jgi:hypothetical protein
LNLKKSSSNPGIEPIHIFFRILSWQSHSYPHTQPQSREIEIIDPLLSADKDYNVRRRLHGRACIIFHNHQTIVVVLVTCYTTSCTAFGQTTKKKKCWKPFFISSSNIAHSTPRETRRNTARGKLNWASDIGSVCACFMLL